jgi:small subunit ribosomal protein S13
MAEEMRKIVRLLSTDIDGNLTVGRALRRVRGISFMYSRSVCRASGIDINRKLGTLNIDEVKKLEKYVRNPEVPAWLLNRRKDPDTGIDTHIVGGDIALMLREDINIMKRSRSYKGIRHEQGLPVRGQRTRSSFRSQKTVGVAKKKVRMEAKKAAPEAKK